MKKVLSAALLSVVISAPAFAGDLYVGGMVGQSPMSGSDGANLGGFVGYKLNGVLPRDMGLAVEGSYNRLGSFSIFGTTYTTSAFGGDAVVTYAIPSVRNLSAFGKLGVSITSSSVAGSSSSTNLSFGGGAQYDVNDQIAVRAGVQTYNDGNSSGSSLYGAALYSF